MHVTPERHPSSEQALTNEAQPPARARRASEIDPRYLRSCLGRFATGVTVVSYEADGVARGATVNSFTSVSMEPPLVLVSLARTSRSAALLEESSFVVNVLAANQTPLALNFAGRPVEGLDVPWVAGAPVPRLRGTAAWFECEPWDRVDAGDHVLFLGRVVAYDQRSVAPLLFQTGQFKHLGETVSGSGRPLPGLSHSVALLHRKSEVEGLATEGSLASALLDTAARPRTPSEQS